MRPGRGKTSGAPFPDLSVGRDILTDFSAASAREWLATNGIGGYAAGSLSGASTRRYHGLLVAALTPPTGRRILLSRLEETVSLAGTVCELAANQYPGAVHPQGFRFLERFKAWPAPAFHYRPCPGVLIEKRVWMAHGQNTTYVQYTLRESPEPVALRLTPLVCWKDYHAEMHPWEGFPVSVEVAPGEMRLLATADTPLLRLTARVEACAHSAPKPCDAPETEWERAGYWHYNVEHQRERERGLDWREDLYCPGHFHAMLPPGASLTLTATVEDTVEPPDAAWRAHVERLKELLSSASATDDYTRALVLAADAFLVEREMRGQGDGRTRGNGETKTQRPNDPTTQQPNAQRPTPNAILAGYPWFTDWGRDTMIALPGLCLATGRAKEARDILTSFVQFVSRGMLPNRFPDAGEEPEYNTVDATLWYFQAVREYVRRVPDGPDLAHELWPVLSDIIAWHLRGTRYGIGVDPADGLLRAGEPGVQLTWMDAKVGDWVVTPRAGKPVEINALWINALCVMEELAAEIGADGRTLARRVEHAANSFRARFIRPDGRGLYDVITDAGPDLSIRPNQILAVSLPFSPLTREEQKTTVDTVERELLTPFGLRTLAPEDPAYRPHYVGSQRERDGAYHQGTVWPWLLGPFVEAHYRVYGDAERAKALLLPLREHLREAGVGFISEIFDGDPPHAPNGCIAQAWSVAEALRAWRILES
jgi:glycogen debranching enzyme